MTDDSLGDVVQFAPLRPLDHLSIAPGIYAALAYIDGLHAFAVAVVRCDFAAMRQATDAIEAAALTIANQRFTAPADGR